MADFPLLKTGAVAQYPLQLSISFQTEAVKFLNGSQQKFRLRGAGLRRWSIKLDELDESEVASLTAFVEQHGTSSFQFKDPLSGDAVPRCVIGGDRFQAGTLGERAGTAEVTIEELP